MNINWDDWGPPLWVIAGGLALGVSAIGLGRKRSDPAMAAEGARDDLAQNRAVAVEQLKALELEKDKLDPALYQIERDALIARGASAMRELEEGAPASEVAPGDLAARLRAERQAVGDEAFAAAVRAIAPELAPARPAMAPEWKGAGYAFAACGLVALLYTMAQEDSVARRDGASMTGNQDLGAPEQAGEQAMPPQWEEARKAEEAKLAANPADVDAMNNLTQLWLSAGDATKAMEYNRKAFEVDPKNIDARVFKAVLAATVGMYDKALADLDAVLVEAPTDPRAMTYRALILLEMGRATEAIPALEAAVQAQPGNPMLMRALGKAREMAGGGAAAPAAPSGPAEVLLSGKILLDPAKAATLTGNEVLFVSLRDPAGGPPLGAVKLPPGPFPETFEVTTANLISMAGPRPVPAMVNLSVRIDADGNPMTREEGAPMAAMEGVAKGSTNLEITLQ